MNSKRIIAIASLVDRNSSVIDIGTDHAYVPIYLIKNNITDKVDASDISKDVLKKSKENIIKYGLDDRIELFLSDGLKNITKEYDIAIICGMGTNTILKILDNTKAPNTLIIQSNRQIPLLRNMINKIGYIINKEVYVFENNKYYVVIKYVKGYEKLSIEQIDYGKYPNKEYLNYELNRLLRNYRKNKNEILLNSIDKLKSFIEKIPD